MRLFSKKINLLNISFCFVNREKEIVEIIDSYADLKRIEFVHLTLNQFAKILYTVPKNLPDTKLLLEKFSNISDNSNLEEIIESSIEELRDMYSDQNEKESKYISKLYFKSAIQRGLKTKFPLKISNNELIRTIPLTAKLAIDNSSDLEKEILRSSMSFQTNKYLTGLDYRNMQNMINIPIDSFQHGLHNRKIEI